MSSEAQAVVASYQEALTAHDVKLAAARDALAAAKRAQALDPTPRTAKAVIDARSQIELLEDQTALMTEGLEAARAALVEAQHDDDKSELVELQEIDRNLDAQMNDLEQEAARALLSTLTIKARHDGLLRQRQVNAARRQALGGVIDSNPRAVDPKRFSRGVHPLLTAPLTPVIAPTSDGKVAVNTRLIGPREAGSLCIYLFNQDP